MITQAPIYVYWLVVGKKPYFEPGSLDMELPSVLHLFLTKEACDAYRLDVDKFHLGALITRAIELADVWAQLDVMNIASEKYFQSTLQVSLSHVDEDGEIVELDLLWDAMATIH